MVACAQGRESLCQWSGDTPPLHLSTPTSQVYSPGLYCKRAGMDGILLTSKPQANSVIFAHSWVLLDPLVEQFWTFLKTCCLPHASGLTPYNGFCVWCVNRHVSSYSDLLVFQLHFRYLPPLDYLFVIVEIFSSGHHFINFVFLITPSVLCV